MALLEVLEQVRTILESKGRITYRMLRAEFQLDEEALDAVREELIEGERVATDENVGSGSGDRCIRHCH